jgi:hypothetical protein
MALYVLQTRKTGALDAQMDASATSCTLAAATFGTPTGQQIITIDGGDILKAADFKCTIAGTAISSMTLLNGVDVIHAANAPVTMNFVDEHYSALTDFVGARAWSNSVQDNIADSTDTKVKLNTEDYDVGANFTPYTTGDNALESRFVAPVNGYYDVSGIVSWKNCVADKTYYAEIFVDGAMTTRAISANGGSTSVAPMVHDVLYLAKDSYVELYTTQSSGAATSDLYTGATYLTFMSVYLIKEV